MNPSPLLVRACRLTVVAGLVILLAAACGSSGGDSDAADAGQAEPTEATDDEPFIPSGYVGRLELATEMDDPAGYCLDVPGPATGIRLDLPAWAHSCHEGAEPDQVYIFDGDSTGSLHFLWDQYDLCLTADQIAAGAGFSYQPCTGDDTQGFDAASDGSLVLRNTDLCLTVINMERGGSQDEIGTGRTVAAGDWTRTLRLQPCATTIDAFRQWQPVDEPS